MILRLRMEKLRREMPHASRALVSRHRAHRILRMIIKNGPGMLACLGSKFTFS